MTMVRPHAPPAPDPEPDLFSQTVEPAKEPATPTLMEAMERLDLVPPEPDLADWCPACHQPASGCICPPLEEEFAATIQAEAEVALAATPPPPEVPVPVPTVSDLQMALLPGMVDPRGPIKSALVDKFLLPPFTVLDARQGYWQQRKEQWHALGLKEEEGRKENLWSAGDAALTKEGKPTGLHPDYLWEKYGKKVNSATSIFDPVLAEMVLRWFCPQGGLVLDPTCGESSKGIVAGVLGLGYHGVDIRAEQVAANQKQANDIGVAERVRFIHGDATVLEASLPKGQQYDLVFTCPPYYDLEVYSDEDASAMGTYPEFMAWYAWVFAQAVKRMKENRFLCVVVGEIRDKATGEYRSFIQDNIRILRDLGLRYYNEAVLVTAVGSMAVRADRQFGRGRKLVKGHQNVLIFFKGHLRGIWDHFPNLTVTGTWGNDGREARQSTGDLPVEAPGEQPT